MNRDLSLSVVSALAGFALKSTLAFGFCLALSRLVGSAKRKFILWSVFIYGTAGYWLWIASAVLPGWQSLAMAPYSQAQPVSSNLGAWQIPESWAFPLGLTLRAAGVAYLLGLTYLAFAHLRRRRHLKWVLGFTSEPTAELAEAFQSLAETLRVGRSRLMILSGATTPATFGWIRPTVLLPTVCLEQDSSELEDILRHELHHVRRWDSVWNGLAIACRALLFFHPAVWYAVRKTQFDRELACDLAVVTHAPARKGKYAECLVRFARLNVMPEPKSWGIDFAASAENLTVRVHSILAESKKFPAWLLCLRAGSGLTLAALFFGVVPSLAVPFSYAPQPKSLPLTPATPTPAGRTGSGAKAARKVPSRSLGVPKAREAADADLRQTVGQQATLDPPAANQEQPAALMQPGAGPQLLHRGSAGSVSSSPLGKKSAPQQTVTLTDAGGPGEPVKDGDHDGKQTVKQTATALMGIYEQLGSIDHH